LPPQRFAQTIASALVVVRGSWLVVRESWFVNRKAGKSMKKACQR